MKVIDARFSGQGDDFEISGTIQLSDEPELLPCPFCGGTYLDTLYIDSSAYNAVAVHCLSDNCEMVGPRVYVKLGDASSVPAKNAQDLWNTRVPPILDLVARVSGNTIELSGVPQATGLLNISWELVGEVDNA